jgi:hypothetical protein
MAGAGHSYRTSSRVSACAPHVQRLLELLQGVRQTANGWDARCPAHDDSRPSLGIAVGTDGRILLHCRSQGCSAKQIMGALRLGLVDLYPPRENGSRRIVAEYPYRDEAGQLLYEVVRFDPKDFRQRQPNGRGGWTWSTKGVRRVPYRLPELLASDPAETVFVVEGEKDVHALARIGLTATTNAQGAGKWHTLDRPTVTKAFGGRHVVILPDNDGAGLDHADEVARSLRRTAASVKVVELPGVPGKGDVSDWLTMPGNDKPALLRLCEQAAGRTAPGGARDQGAPAPPERPPTQAEVLLGLGGDCELFHAPDGKAFATVPVETGAAGRAGRHQETLAIRGAHFRSYLTRRYYRQTSKAPSAKGMQDALGVLEARAWFDGLSQDVFFRVGSAGDCAVYLDLGDTDWRAVEVVAGGWSLRPPPVKFRRTRTMAPLPAPARGGSVEELRPFVNVGEGPDAAARWRLLVAWLLAALRPRGPYPVLCLHGEQGAAKSTAARVIRALVDPNTVPLRGEPRDLRDLMVMATHSWVVALDNLSYLAPWLSDALCGLSTGGGFSTRELYTDADECVFDAQRPTVLTGIEELATRGDLLDRSLVLTLPAIAEGGYRTEEDFWRQFERVRPQVLGALLDAVARALGGRATVRLARQPRMADFAAWVAAAEPALGWGAGSFLETYLGNRGQANVLALEASPLWPPLRELLDGGPWEGPCRELLDRLEAIAGEKVAGGKRWPKNPRALSGALRRLAPNLRRAGVCVEMPESGGRAGRPVRLSLAPEENRAADLRSPRSARSGAGPDGNAGNARNANSEAHSPAEAEGSLNPPACGDAWEPPAASR